ncbi:hypothetical protein DNTS_013601 [Danionella cerebrum]|uniref:ASD2 domain-containing protein n=1 Tax=Danionella cerebrum TaxID=2873325 RepID=A0A553QCH9_9TELE|nr:hypothetical protein DNTS_013601 [Danionella translucida]
MQLHFTPLSVPWHSGGDNSELCMQWGHISRHYSTDRSSSIGSMESLENPANPGYYDSQLSPIDPVIFNNKRDSAYSSFSASSNTSDYTVSVKPEETHSMDGFLQGLSTSCRFPEGSQQPVPTGNGNQQEVCKRSKILSDRTEANVRPSSYSCEEEHCTPPQPPMRKESFRASRGQPTDKRCVSAPLGIPSVSSHVDEDPPQIQDVFTCNVYLNGTQGIEQEHKGCGVQPYCTFNSHTAIENKVSDNDKETMEKSLDATSSPSLGGCTQRNSEPTLHPEQDFQRHAGPEKVLSAQLHLMDLSSEKRDHCASPTCQWSQSPIYLSDSVSNSAQCKWGISRSSTPGSMTTSEVEDSRPEEDSLDTGQNSWGHPVSVSRNPLGNGFLSTYSQNIENNFGTISAAGCMDVYTNQNGEGTMGDGSVSKYPAKRQFRTSKSRRRSERFATNLRNEIQRKKAQLQSRNPCGEETVEEEVAELNTEIEPLPDYHKQRPQTFQHPPTSSPAVPIQPSKQAPQQLNAMKAEEQSSTRAICYQTSQNQTQMLQYGRQACVHVVEEVAPAGKPRRWRWTPEHKLQPESEQSESTRKEPPAQNWSGKVSSTRARINSSSGRLGRSDESDIPPFADRRRFFEETSRKLSQSVTNLSNLTSRNQRLDKPSRLNHPVSPEPHEIPTNLGRRRFSYQEVPCVNSLDTGRQLVSMQQDHERMRQRLIEREKEKEKEQERLMEQERLREQELEKERLRKEQEKEQQRVKDWEERQMLLQREQEWESKTIQSEPSMTTNVVPHSTSHDAYRKQPPTPRIPSSLQPTERFNFQKSCSAFHPVTTQHNRLDSYERNPPYKPRICTPDEPAEFVEKKEQTRKISRNFSFTERDSSRCRRECRPAEGADFMHQTGHSVSAEHREEHLFSPLRNRAMSENNLCVEIHRFQNHTSGPSVSRMRASTLSDLDENAACDGQVKKKRGPPPPRPPPPKWEEFHKRRASHHSLFSTVPVHQSPTSSPPRPPPNPCPPCPPSVPETSRQRSYSLPPSELCNTQDHSIAPPSPAFSRRAFIPVALPPRERGITVQQELMAQPEACRRKPFPPTAMLEEARVPLVKPSFPDSRVEWNRFSHNPPATGTTRSPEAPENIKSPESYFSMNNLHLPSHQIGNFPGTAQKNHFTSRHSPAGVERANLPLETDIDEIYEQELAADMVRKETDNNMEMRGFARPVLVLETDIDHSPEEVPQPGRNMKGSRCSLVESILEDEYGDSRKNLIGELFPLNVNTEMGGESWRGGFPITGGSLDRPSRLGAITGQGSRSTCYDTSVDNPLLLAKIREISERKEEEQELNYKKQLMESLGKKLCVLRDAQRGLQEDIRANTQLGEEVERLVLAICKPNEVDKYRMFIGDLDKVTNLLLSLSGRLIRVESALDCLDPEAGHQERLQLLEKKKQLLVQMSEAQELKEHVDRREQAVGRVLSCCLTPEQMRDYAHFIKMKAALLVEQRQLDDKIRLGEEQLRGLRESLGMGYSHY